MPMMRPDIDDFLIPQKHVLDDPLILQFGVRLDGVIPFRGLLRTHEKSSLDTFDIQVCQIGLERHSSPIEHPQQSPESRFDFLQNDFNTIRHN
jgi:hypothetical protein